MGKRLERSFYLQDVLVVAPALLGKSLVHRGDDDILSRYVISETEAYRGKEDRACHASRGRTSRTEVMFRDGGCLYMYFIYGMYWMMNVVTGAAGIPQAVLIRGIREMSGPGRLTRHLGLGKDYNGEDLLMSDRIWIEEAGPAPSYTSAPRVGINYAGEPWKSKPWRYIINL